MTTEQLKKESNLIEAHISTFLLNERKKRELFVVDLFFILIPLFMLYPIIYVIIDYIGSKPLSHAYIFVFIYLVSAFIYYRVSKYLLLRSESFFEIACVINVIFESISVTFMFLAFSNVFSKDVILSGPLSLAYISIIVISNFRLSLRLSVLSGVFCALFYTISAMYMLLSQSNGSAALLYYVISAPGIIFQAIMFIFIGVVTGYLSLNSKNIIRNIGIKNYETQQIKQIFGKYVSTEVRDQILQKNANLGGELNYGIILFSNINNFEELLSADPKSVILQLNEYLGATVQIVEENHGIINKFVGDMVMVVFGLSETQENDTPPELASVISAVQMQDKIEELNIKWRVDGKQLFNMGIGIASGVFLTGNIGSNTRKEFTCIGDVVNTASRLQSLARNDVGNNKILITEEIEYFLRIHDKDSLSHIGNVSLKGKSKKINVFEVNRSRFRKMFIKRDIDELIG